MREHGVVPGNDLRLKQFGSDNVIVKVDNQRAASHFCVVLLVGTGEVSELCISLLMGANNVEGEREGIVISVVSCEEFIEKMKFIGRQFGKGLVTEKVGHNIFGSGKINNFRTIFLNNQPPVVDTIVMKFEKVRFL